MKRKLLGMKTRRLFLGPLLILAGAVLSVVVVWVLGLMVAMAFFGGSDEATWGATFYGIIFALVALPAGLIGAVWRCVKTYRLMSVRERAERRSENGT